MLPGSFTGAYAYRRELPPGRQIIPATAAALAGAAVGALALLLLPPAAFTRAVPYLVGTGCILVLLPRPRRAVRTSARGGLAALPGNAERMVRGYPPLVPGAATATWGRPRLWGLAAAFGAGVYGGYFFAGMGIIFIGVLFAATAWGTQPVLAAKNVLATAVLVIAVALYAAQGHVAWLAAAPLAAGSIAGGPVGAWLAQRMATGWIKAAVGAIGVATIVHALT
jgi:hypothetical protein